MEVANVTVALGGDAGNTVPKYGVTVSEVAVLRTIHGEDAVVDIEPTGTITRTHREERARLKEIYGRAKDGNQNSFVDALFPGAASRLFERFDELELPESFYKAERRVASKPVLAPATEKMPEGLTAKEKAAWKKAQKERETEAAKTAAETDDKSDEDDGIEDMPAAGGVLS